MIDQRLIDTINSGRAWAFVGSGASVDAGLPGWQDLYALLFRGLSGADPDGTPAPGDLPRAFGQLVTRHGRPAVLAHIAKVLATPTQPGAVLRLLASWPFTAYVTTNYDTLLDAAMQAHAAWVSIGNTLAETKKISGEVANVVWHPHGIIGATDATSQLIITQEDYDNTYPAGSAILETLKALLRMRSLVFVGFGFNDPDLGKLLELVARLSDPAQPAYAFLSDSTPERREELRTKYNVVTIPYEAAGGNHAELSGILRHYSNFIANRDIIFGGTPAAPPRYDPEVASLIVQNALHGGSMEVPAGTRERVMRASMLAALSTHGALSAQELEQHVRFSPKAATQDAFQSSLDMLVGDGMVARREGRCTLTPAAVELTTQRQGSAQLLFQKFFAAIRRRAMGDAEAAAPDGSRQRVAGIAATFFQDICRRRGLAVAQNLSGGPEGHLQRRAVALLQELPEWFGQCQSLEETRALTNVVFGVLSDPKEPERIYLGSLAQAYFGKHIAGVEEESVALRRQLLAETVFVLDSHFVIVLLARGCMAHDHAVELVRLLREAGAVLMVTDLILVETTEHLEWAMKEVTGNGQGTSLQKAFDITRGAAGQTNAFLEGYAECRARTECESFGQYVVAIGGQPHSRPPAAQLVRSAVARYGIALDGIRDPLTEGGDSGGPAAEIVERIAGRRREYGSFRHGRQVTAEAQIVAFVSGMRSGELAGRDVGGARQAFFVTDSRILDGLEGCPERICMTPDGLYQWLLATRAFTPEMAANVFDHLLLEFMESGIQFVPTERIAQAFGPIVQAGREQLGKLIAEHRVVLESYYGSEQQEALSRIDDLLVVDAVEFLSNTVLREQTSRLAFVEARRREAEEKLRKMVALGEDVDRYQRRRREKQKRRAAQSRARSRKEREKERRKQKKG